MPFPKGSESCLVSRRENTMQVLNDTKLVSSLKDMTEAVPMGEEPEDGFFVCPEGMSKEQTMLLTTILQAKKPKELLDIPTEEIIDLWEHVSSYAQCITNKTIFDDISFASRLIGLPSTKKR